MLALDLVGCAAVAAFFISLLIYCLRMRVVGGGWGCQPDASREMQPIRYWTGIAALALGASFSTAAFLYIAWTLVD